MKEKKSLTYSQRGEFALNPVARKLFSLMDEKRSNLSVAVDVESSEELLHFADLLGPEMALIKTHVDILSDFTHGVREKLVALADKHHFLIFEDRKFADIGATAASQYAKGPFQMVEWADLVNAHTVAGASTIEGLKRVGLERARALLLIAQMSTPGNLITESYTEKSVQLAMSHRDFVIGFISQRQISDDPAFLHLTPGVHLVEKGDALGQGYITPKEALIDRQSDLIIVGRGILAAHDPLKEARRYREAAFGYYQERLLKGN